jgi:hypothetical protein
LNETYNVTSPPNLTVRPYAPLGDVDLAFPVNVTLSGGEGPFNLSWRALPNGTNDSELLPDDGTFVIPLVPTDIGRFFGSFEVHDALGGTAGGSYTLGMVGPPPTLTLAAPSAPAEAGVPLHLQIRMSGGTPPYRWTVEPSKGVANATALSGNVGAAGEVNWSGTPASGGNLSLEAVVLDALGGLANATTTLAVAAPLYLGLGVSNGSTPGSGVASLDLDVEGGTPPYELAVREAGVVAAYENLSGPGPVHVTLQVPSPGYVTFSAQVQDANGVVKGRSAATFVAAPPAGAPTQSPPTASPAVPGQVGADPTLSLLALGALGVGIVALVLRDRRRRTGSGAPPSSHSPSGPAMEFVRRSLAEGDGLEAETLVLLAEEEGISETALRSALGRWERAGRLRRDPDGTGAELLSWQPGTAAPTTSPRAAPEG